MADENTVSVEAGSTLVHGHLTQFVGFPGDTFNCDGLSVPVASVDSTSQMTLTYGWPGSDVVDSAAWSLQRTSAEWSSAVQIHKSVATLVQRVEGGLPLSVNAAGTPAGRALYDDAPEGFSYVEATTDPDDPFLLSFKLSDANADWSSRQALKGSTAESTATAVAARDDAVAARNTAVEKASEAAADRTQTGLDRTATAADRVQTGLDRAATAADRAVAVAASEASQTNANFYPTVSAGLAATTNGQQFIVPDGDRNVRYRRDSSTVAVQLTDYPTAAAIDPLQRTNGSVFAVEDADGNLGVDIQSPLRVSTEGELETTALQYFTQPGKWLWGLRDQDGNIPIGVDNHGRLVANFDLVPASSVATAQTAQVYDYDVNHIMCYGQSRSVGQALPVQSGSPRYDTLMFARGMRPQYDYPSETSAEWYASLVPAVEVASPNPTWSNVLGETPSRGTADMVKQLIEREDGRAYTDHKYRLLVSNPGYGSTTIAQLSKGSAYYARMVEQAGYGLSLANAQGDTYAVQAVTWLQGETDYQSGTTQAAYLAALNTLVADIQTDIKAVTGQDKRIVVIGDQVASHIHGASDDIPDIALAQLECSETNPNFYLASPTYHLSYTDGFHPNGASSRWDGAYLALAYKRIVIDGIEWSPLRPVSAVRQAKMVELRFHVPYGNLVLDAIGVPAQPHYGFQLVDAAGSPLTISGVDIVDRDRVRITAASAIPGGSKVRYAWQGDAARGLGNLRDTQGDVIRFDPETSGLPMHNWCVIFERTI